MSVPDQTPTPAQDVLAGTGDLEPDVELWVMFVPQATQDNYAQIARDQAAIRGVEPSAVLREMADAWDELHERQPLDGYDHLAQWARQHDPAADVGPSGLTVLQARALESARRDPFQSVIGDQAFVAEGIAAQKVQDAAISNATAAPSIDPASGLLPNAGPLTPPADVVDAESGAAGSDTAAAPSQDAPSSPPPTTTSSSSDSPPPTSQPSSSSSRGGGKGNGGGGSSPAAGDTPPTTG